MDEVRDSLVQRPVRSANTLQRSSATDMLPFDVSILAGQVSERSKAMYTRDFAPYCVFAGTSGVALQPETLARWRAALAGDGDKKYSPHTINRMLAAVKSIMRAAAEQGYISPEVADGFRRVRGVSVRAMRDRLKDGRRTKIEPQDMRRLCELPDTTTPRGLRDAALLHTLASSGLRVAEVSSLRADRIVKDDRGFVLRIRGKNDIEDRDAPLSGEAYHAIQRWVMARPIPSEYVFTSFSGGNKNYSHRDEPLQHRLTARPLTSAAVWQIVQRYAKECQLSHIKPHDFRRFVGTQLARIDIRKAQKALGHKRIDTTAQHYIIDELERGMTDTLY